MTDPNKIALQLVVDRSGSMVSIQPDMQGGINTLIKEQSVVEGSTCLLSLAQFDTLYDEVYTDVDLTREIPEYVLVPRGMTALYDAVGRTITSLGARLAAMPEDDRPGKVMFVIVTDGLENASKEFTGLRVKDLVDRQTNDYQWEFVYLGANQDAFDVAAILGVAAANTMNYGANTVGTQAMSSTVSGMTTRYRASGVAGFTKDEQDAGDATVTP